MMTKVIICSGPKGEGGHPDFIVKQLVFEIAVARHNRVKSGPNHGVAAPRAPMGASVGVHYPLKSLVLVCWETGISKTKVNLQPPTPSLTKMAYFEPDFYRSNIRRLK